MFLVRIELLLLESDILNSSLDSVSLENLQVQKEM